VAKQNTAGKKQQGNKGHLQLYYLPFKE
jgi:hypothetical protein